MGTERARGRKQIHLCAVLLISLIPLACTLSQSLSMKTADTGRAEAQAHLARGRKLLDQGDYVHALRENEKVLSLTGMNIPRDESLFSIGLIYAYPANPARDYGKSLASFRRLLTDYPGSPLAQQAKTLAGLLQENEKLDRTVERLNTIIDELKKVDIDVDRKRRGRGK